VERRPALGQRKRQELLARVAEQDAQKRWTTSTRRNINDYGQGAAYVRDVSLIKKRKR
jgi:hypothetical protein